MPNLKNSPLGNWMVGYTVVDEKKKEGENEK